MPLSEWPEKFQDRPEPRGEIVEIVFDDRMLVVEKTEGAIGLNDADEYGNVPLWIPISQIDGTVPERGEWIDWIRIPQWLAEEKGLMRCHDQ